MPNSARQGLHLAESCRRNHMPKNHPPLTAERLREVLSYDPDTGEFRRKVRTSNRIKAGEISGSEDGSGYKRIRVDGRKYKAHRLAWLYVHGRWPEKQLDHENNIRSDNRIKNLREATNAQNAQNQAARCTNNSGHTGVAWCKKASKWRAYINAESGRVNLGSFGKIEDAIAARRAGKAVFHTFNPSDRITQQEPSQ